jgi:hypothetical protein
MSRVINSDLPAQKRKKILRLITNSIMVLEKEKLPENDINDLIAFIILSLVEAEKTIIQTTIPWEKRDYWVKADQFRNEWKWVCETKTRLMLSRTAKGWIKIPPEIGELKEQLKLTDQLKHIQEKVFWKGAYKVLLCQK